MRLYPHQQKALDAAADRNRVAFYHDMGLGKTFTGAEKMHQLGAKLNLVICQKSKINDWIEHFKLHYQNQYHVLNLTDKTGYIAFWEYQRLKAPSAIIGVINYELAFRRPDLLKLSDFTLMLDESSMIQNEQAKRTKFILKMQPRNVILLSGTPTGGKYEKLWSQLHLLGWNISKKMYYSNYVIIDYMDAFGHNIPIIKGYKNVNRLKRKLSQYGAQFLKTDEVIDLPEQIFTTIKIDPIKEYRHFKKHRIIEIDGKTLVGDTTLTKMLYERQLCSQYNINKLSAVRDLLDSTEDNIVLFYNFNAELEALKKVVKETDRRCYVISGSEKSGEKIPNYSENHNYRCTLIVQYQAGAMGLNLQNFSNRIIYYSLPLSSELFEQSKKRIHRIGQEKTCFYSFLICKNSIEEKIFKALEMRKDYTEKLFEKGE